MSEHNPLGIEDKPVRAEYRRLNPQCAYCEEAATVIRVTLTMHGSAIVSTLCDKDAEGEKQQAIADGFVMVGETSVAGVFSDASLVDPKVMEELTDAIRARAAQDSSETP